jgi:hypothetical protein
MHSELGILGQYRPVAVFRGHSDVVVEYRNPFQMSNLYRLACRCDRLFTASIRADA